MPRKRRKWNLRGLIIGALRRIFLYSPTRKEIKAKARLENGNYVCALCKEDFVRKETVVDHIRPVVDPSKGFPQIKMDCQLIDDWTTYVNRLFCKASNLQCICKKCHKRKTEDERKRRVKERNKRARNSPKK